MLKNAAGDLVPALLVQSASEGCTGLDIIHAYSLIADKFKDIHADCTLGRMVE